ncbi:mannose-P-dolichol utilization defect 1 protein-like isoform X2 [Salarias fasciatus]|uniref:mannose-P-dolichol utilization defect 1 protein-like isoform X2 n=1 Tax=Salarias fasciatus TaxID=181472 RepID=UPI001176E280|nr:mannose-P-dolichol utilization defect 1 protein-like isoform X2 [Salarias fasciatus]
MAASQVRDFLVTYLMPEKCYDEIFVRFHFHAQLPQLLKILWRGSAEGISLFSVLLQLYAFSCPVVYAVAHNFPLFAWAERVLMLVQTAAIVLLILYHRGETLKGLLLLVGFGGVMFLLSSYAPAAIVSAMHDSSLAALIASKALQALTNHRNGHTGQLSTVSVFLSCAGSLGVAFVSLQDSIYSVTSLSLTLSASLSCVLLAQVICSSSSFATDAKKKE